MKLTPAFPARAHTISECRAAGRFKAGVGPHKQVHETSKCCCRLLMFSWRPAAAGTRRVTCLGGRWWHRWRAPAARPPQQLPGRGGWWRRSGAAPAPAAACAAGSAGHAARSAPAWPAPAGARGSRCGGAAATGCRRRPAAAGCCSARGAWREMLLPWELSTRRRAPLAGRPEQLGQPHLGPSAAHRSAPLPSSLTRLFKGFAYACGSAAHPVWVPLAASWRRRRPCQARPFVLFADSITCHH